MAHIHVIIITLLFFLVTTGVKQREIRMFQIHIKIIIIGYHHMSKNYMISLKVDTYEVRGFQQTQ